MNNKCSGCGVNLQSNDPKNIGYVSSKDHNLCERCFRIKHYSDYQKVVKDENDIISILDSINKTNDLVVLVIDLMDMPKDLSLVNKNLNNDIILVLTKRDLLPKSLYEDKLKDYLPGNYADKIIVSSNNNYHFDELFDAINAHKKSNNVYVVGYTNAGKSTLINKVIYNYSDYESTLTTSFLPSTTLDAITIKINDNLNIIDTPGIIDNNNIINQMDSKDIKMIVPKKTIKPVTYQINTKQYFVVNKLLQLESSNNTLIFYMANQLPLKRLYLRTNTDNFVRHEINVAANNDLVISGLLFIKCIKKENIVVYTLKNVDVYTRKSLI
jgi:small GTP-binding protein